MNKRIIREIPVRIASDEDVEHAALSDARIVYVHAGLHSPDLLVLSVYEAEKLRTGERSPVLCTYLERNDHITCAFSNESRSFVWRESKLSSTLMNRPVVMLLGGESLSALRQYYADPNASLKSVHRHQDAIGAVRLANSHQRIIDAIDRQMALVPPLPDDYDAFIQRDVFPARYLFYDYSRRKCQLAFCTECRKEVAISNPKNNTVMRCPSCGASVLAKSNGRCKGEIRETHNFMVPQKTTEGFVFRYFAASRTEKSDGARHVTYFEQYRVLASGNKMVSYAYRKFLSSDKVRWGHFPNQDLFFNDGVCRYPANLRVILAGTTWQFSAADMYKSKGTQNLHWYLHQYRKHPFLESLLKVGMTNFAAEVVERAAYCDLDWNAKRLHRLLGVSKNALRALIAENGDSKMVLLVRLFESLRLRIDMALIAQVQSIWGRRSEDFIRSVLPYIGMQRAMRYGETLGETEREDWLDYLHMAKDLGYDLRREHALFPRHLKEAHDTVTLLHREKVASKTEEAFAAIVPGLMRFAWQPEGEEMMVVAPDKSIDIVHEGHALNHCVHSYIWRVVSGDSAILFLRNRASPDKPFVTLHVRGNSVVQARAFDNKELTDDASTFLDKYRTHLTKLTA